MMNLLEIYIGKDAYDYKRPPTHYRQETNVHDETIQSYLDILVKDFKANKFPWYLMTVTTFEIGGEVNTVHYHNAHPMKEKIILNKQAKESAKPSSLNDKLQELIDGHHGLAVNVAVPGAMIAEPPPHHNFWVDELAVPQQVAIDD
jgi:DNA-directed RNA polymerase subunit L